jgi:hypothetical protein
LRPFSSRQFGQPSRGIRNPHWCPVFRLAQIAHQLNGFCLRKFVGESGQGAVHAVVGEFAFD